MSVYSFEKSFLERLKEAESVLSWDGAVVPASQVKSEWKSYIELQIEPTGWQALWKIPRVICEDLKLRFPTIVSGYVDQVIFDELKAVFVVTAVLDNDVHLPERNEVSLVDLYPTINQENTALNVETTADCIDRLRFFYTHVWMPWDKDLDDDRDWVQMHLQSRIQLACDLKNKMPRLLALHMRNLFMEARYIQERLDFLELDLSDDEGDIEQETIHDKGSSSSANSSLNKSNLPVTDLMCLHLRLAIIRSEFEILENPEMRRAYSELQTNKLRGLRRSASRSNNLDDNGRRTKMCYLVMQPCELQQQMSLLNLAKQHVEPQTLVQIGSKLQDVLSLCRSNDDILLSPGQHTIKFLERLNDNGSISGLVGPRAAVLAKRKDILSADKLAIISSSDEDSTLLVVDGDFTLSHLLLDCGHVRRCILVRSGTLHLHGCRLIGDGCSSTQEGILCLPEAKLLLADCLLENFATGISMQSHSSAELSDVSFKSCQSGLELLDDTVAVKLKGNKCSFDDCKLGILAEGFKLQDKTESAVYLRRYSELQHYNELNLVGNCNFYNCTHNVRVANIAEEIMSKRTKEYLMQDEYGSENKENIN